MRYVKEIFLMSDKKISFTKLLVRKVEIELWSK